MTEAVDDEDARIVAALQSNPRAELLEIAEITSIPGTTVRDRLKAMEERGIVEGYRVVVDYERAGYGTQAVFRLQVRDEAVEAVSTRLREVDRFRTVYEVTGEWNILAIGTFGSAAELDSYSKELVTDSDVQAVTAGVVMRTVSDGKQIDPSA